MRTRVTTFWLTIASGSIFHVHMDLHALTPAHYAVIAVCAGAAVTDARSGRIYNRMTVPAMVAGIAWAAWRGGDGALAASMAGLALGIVPFALAAWRGWVGGGDVKLFGAIGALAGPWVLLDCLFVAFLLAALWGLALIVRGERRPGPGRLASGVWKRLTARAEPGEGLLDRPLRMGVFVLAGAVAAVLRVAG